MKTIRRLSLFFLFLSGFVAAQDGESNKSGVLVVSQRWYKNINFHPMAPTGAETSGPRPPPVTRPNDGRFPNSNDSFIYEAIFKNATGRKIKGIAWDYIFSRSENNEEIQRHKFTSYLEIGKDKTATIKEISPSPPTNLIRADDMTKDWKSPYRERIYIRCLIFNDNTTWKNEDAPADDCNELAKFMKVMEEHR